jgi:predicted ATPase
MTEAIVLGDNERMVWQKNSRHTLFYRKETYLDFGQMTMDDFGMECKTSQKILQEYEEE